MYMTTLVHNFGFRLNIRVGYLYIPSTFYMIDYDKSIAIRFGSVTDSRICVWTEHVRYFMAT
jgi:hypothetical protein